MLKRILITSDFLRANAREQRSNRPWLHTILERPIAHATGIAPIPFASVDESGQEMFRRQFFALSDCRRFDADIRQFHFTRDEITPASLQYLSIFIHPGDLVIGYELSPATKALIGDAGAEWIDVWLHPVRYLDDILLAFSASNADVYAAMAAFAVPESTFELYADLHRARITRQIDKGMIKGIDPDSALFVGQTLHDVSVCRDGAMLSILDFKERVEETARRHRSFYYSRHPHVRGGDEDILRYTGKIGMTPAPASCYTLLASGLVTQVLSVSSSVLHEAKYFGVAAECLFVPVLRLGTDFATDHLSIFHDFFSPHFWEAALRPLTPVVPCRETAFLDKKDKLRDALAFYWSYREIDKTEAMRHDVTALRKEMAAVKKSLPPRAAGRIAAKRPNPFEREETALAAEWHEIEKDFLAGISPCSVVSFDIFETLIERRLDYPVSLFGLMQDDARRIAGAPGWDFVEDRRAARGMVRDGRHGEEVTLAERYDALARERGFAPGTGTRLLEMELAHERRLCAARASGKRLFELALERGKRIVLVSDTYFDKDFVLELLRTNGYAGFQDLFVSSETGRLKSTGSMFAALPAALGVKPSDICHVGDNQYSDVVRAREAGLRTLHRPWHSDIFKEQNRVHRNGGYAFAERPRQSAIRHLVSKRLYDRPRNPEPAADFGYAVLGPLFYGYAAWVLARAEEDGIRDLYFLARDGDIVKKCCDVLAGDDATRPRRHYLKVSRRALHMAAMRTPDDVKSVLSLPFGPATIDILLQNRFGLPPPDDALLAQAGIHDRTMALAHGRHKFILDNVAERIADTVLTRAQEEREAMTAYCASLGLDGNNAAAAVVDIGHRGTLQRLLMRLLGNDALRGYYFATQTDGTDVSEPAPSASAYLCENVAVADKSHFYNSNLPMFETVFLNGEDSLVRVFRDGEGFGFDHSPRGDAGGKRLAAELHRGALEFCADASGVFSLLGLEAGLEAPEAVAPFLAVLKAPDAEDAGLFEHVVFERYFTCNGETPLFVRSGKGYDSEKSLWKEGAAALNRRRERRGAKHMAQSVVYKLLKTGIRRFGNAAQYARFVESPYSTLADSRRRWLRLLSRLLD